MISVRRQQSPAAFGPQSSPLYYTMLSRPPQRLIVAGLSGDSLCRTMALLLAAGRIVGGVGSGLGGRLIEISYRYRRCNT